MRIGVDEYRRPITQHVRTHREVRGDCRLADAAFLASDDHDAHLSRSRRIFASRRRRRTNAADEPVNLPLGRRQLCVALDRLLARNWRLDPFDPIEHVHDTRIDGFAVKTDLLMTDIYELRVKS